jgi:predicted PurR-regulated permease PerM
VIEPPTAELKPDRSLAASIAIAGCAIVAFVALLVLAWHSAPTILLLFSGVLFGVFLVALSDLVGRLIGGPHALRLVIVCVFLTGLFGGVMVLGGATIAQQAVALSDTIRSQVRTVRTFLEERGIETNFLNLDQTPSTSEQPQTPPSRPNLPSASTIASGTGAILAQTWKILSGLFEAIGNIFIIVLLGLLLATQPGLYRRGVLRLLPRRYASDAAQLADDIGETLRRWLIGQLMTMSFIFVITWIGLAVIGIPGALVLGFIAGFLAFIPNIGAVLAGVLIVLASRPLCPRSVPRGQHLHAPDPASCHRRASGDAVCGSDLPRLPVRTMGPRACTAADRHCQRGAEASSPGGADGRGVRLAMRRHMVFKQL